LGNVSRWKAGCESVVRQAALRYGIGEEEGVWEELALVRTVGHKIQNECETLIEGLVGIACERVALNVMESLAKNDLHRMQQVRIDQNRNQWKRLALLTGGEFERLWLADLLLPTEEANRVIRKTLLEDHLMKGAIARWEPKLEALVSQRPPDTILETQKAWDLYQWGQHKEALEMAERILQKERDNPWALDIQHKMLLKGTQ
jgi:hypothetical protein